MGRLQRQMCIRDRASSSRKWTPRASACYSSTRKGSAEALTRRASKNVSRSARVKDNAAPPRRRRGEKTSGRHSQAALANASDTRAILEAAWRLRVVDFNQSDPTGRGRTFAFPRWDAKKAVARRDFHKNPAGAFLPNAEQRGPASCFLDGRRGGTVFPRRASRQL